MLRHGLKHVVYEFKELVLKIIVQKKGSCKEWFPAMDHVNVHTVFHSQKCKKQIWALENKVKKHDNMQWWKGVIQFKA